MIYVWHHKSRSHLFWVSPKASRSAWFSSFNCSDGFGGRDWFHTISMSKRFEKTFLVQKPVQNGLSHVLSVLKYPMFITFSHFCDFPNCILWRLACRIRSSAVELPAPPPPMLYKPLFQAVGVTVFHGLSETLPAEFGSTLLLLFSISASRKNVQTTWLQELKRRCLGTEFQNQE